MNVGVVNADVRPDQVTASAVSAFFCDRVTEPTLVDCGELAELHPLIGGLDAPTLCANELADPRARLTRDVRGDDPAVWDLHLATFEQELAPIAVAELDLVRIGADRIIKVPQGLSNFEMDPWDI